MSRRSQSRNQYESESTGELAAGAFSLPVVSAAGFELDEPIYLVIEPDVPGQREWIRVISITGNTFNIDPSPNDHGSTGRNLAGSDGDLTHPAGSKVRSVPTEQIFLDIFQDIEDDELDLTQHETDGADPHASAQYLKVGDTDALYVKLAGSTMTGDLVLFQDPSLALGAATKQYVDQEVAAVPPQTFLHADLIDVTANQHHVKYLDAEAVAAMGLVGDLNDLNHVKFSDADAVAAMGVVGDGNDLNHVKYTDAAALAAAVAGIVSGTPSDGQVAIWTDADTMEGSAIGASPYLAASTASTAQKAHAVASGGSTCNATVDEDDIQAVNDA